MVKLLIGVDDATPLFIERLFAFEQFCKDFPKLKVTLFVPANYSMQKRPFFYRILRKTLPFPVKKKLFNALKPKTEKNRIDLNIKFVDFLKKQIAKKRFSVELHGWTHFCVENLSAEEFLFLNKMETRQRIEKSINAFFKAGFPKPKVLAPPGWAVTQELLSVLREKNLAIAGSMTSMPLQKNAKSIEAGIKGVSALQPERFNGVLNIPRNWDLKKGTIERAKKIIELGGLIGVHAHVMPIGVENDLSEENLSNLRSLLEFLEKERIEVEFLHFRELL